MLGSLSARRSTVFVDVVVVMAHRWCSGSMCQRVVVGDTGRGGGELRKARGEVAQPGFGCRCEHGSEREK